MAEKLVSLGVERDPAFLYFVRKGDVWRVARPREELADAERRPQLVIETEAEMDANFVYFLDGDGDLSRVRRAASAPKRHKKRAGGSAR